MNSMIRVNDFRSNSRKRHQRHRSESYDEHREAEEGSFRIGNNASKGVINGNESDAWHQVKNQSDHELQTFGIFSSSLDRGRPDGGQSACLQYN